MNLKVCGVIEALSASGADVGPLAAVPRHVRAQSIRAVEALVAHRAQVRLLLEVRLPVPVQQRLGGERALADGACRLLGRPRLVGTHVHF